MELPSWKEVCNSCDIPNFPETEFIKENVVSDTARKVYDFVINFAMDSQISGKEQK